MSRGDDPTIPGHQGETPYRTLPRLIQELKPFRGLVALCAVLTLLQSAFGLLPPIILGDIVNKLQKGVPINTLVYLAYITGFATMQGLLGYALGVAMASLGQRFLITTRDRMLGHMQRLPLAYYEKNQIGKLVSNVVNDAATVQGLITTNLTQMLGDAVQLVLVLVYLLSINAKLAGLSLIIAPLYIYNFRRFYKPLQVTSDEIRGKRDAMYGQMQEKLAGIQTVKGFGQERYEARSFMSTTRELMGLNVHQGALGGRLWTLADAMCGLATGLVLWYGGTLAMEGKLGAGTLVVFLSLSVGYIYGPIVRFLVVLDPIARAQAALYRIFRTLDTVNPISDKPGALPMPTINGLVRFENVWFEYEPGQPVLKGIQLEAKPGQTIALVGFSGSGKTTMISLLQRFYDPTSGAILIDGKSITDIDKSFLRSRIGVVQQDTFLFRGTIAENISLGDGSITRERIEYAAKMACLTEVIAKRAGGLDAKVEERGANLSVGERQLIAFARILAFDPDILILDEATSNIDSKTENLIQVATRTVRMGRTSFIIAHRISTIVDCDRIVVIDHSRIKETGPHDALLAANGLYAALYKAQVKNPQLFQNGTVSLM